MNPVGLPYDEMIRLQHAMMVLGNDGSGRYNGATRIEYQMSPPAEVPPGRYRNETHSGLDGRNVMTYQIQDKVPEGLSPRVQRLIQAYIDDPATDKTPEPKDAKILDEGKFTGLHSSIDVLQLPRVNRKVRVWNQIYSRYITHHYPKHGDVPFMIKAMEEVMEEIRKVPKNSLNKALNLIEEYLYLGIHAHPFDSANFSIVMAQTNYLLSRFGLNGISHTNIDWVGLPVELLWALILKAKLLKESLFDSKELMLKNIISSIKLEQVIETGQIPAKTETIAEAAENPFQSPDLEFGLNLIKDSLYGTTSKEQRPSQAALLDFLLGRVSVVFSELTISNAHSSHGTFQASLVSFL